MAGMGVRGSERACLLFRAVHQPGEENMQHNNDKNSESEQ